MAEDDTVNRQITDSVTQMVTLLTGRSPSQSMAAFAVAQASTPLEFTDYYRAYLEIAAKLAVLDKTPDDRARCAQAAVDTLRPLLFGALNGPPHSDPE